MTAVSLRRPALIAGLTALLLGAPTAALAQTAHPAGASPAHRAAVIRSWQRLHRMTGITVPAWAAGKPATAPRAPKRATGIQGGLGGVTTLSGTSAWAAGFQCASGCGSASEVDNTLAMHWDGQSWAQTQPASLSPSASYSYLNGVAARSDTDVWAVGDYCASACGTGSDVVDTLIEHWDGQSWTQIPSPSPGSTISALTSVSADSATDAWAVGISCSGGCTKFSTLTEHWDGTTWSKVSSPSPDKSANFLSSSASLSPASGWADGSDGAHNLMLRWNGKSWAKVSTPSPSKIFNYLNGLAAQAAKNVWAVGAYCSGCTKPSGVLRTLILHWNGKSWAKVPSPNLSGSTELDGVTAPSAKSAWATGIGCASSCGKSAEVDKAVILHWNGKSWAKASVPAASSSFSDLYGVSADAAGDAWAVGQACTSGCGTSAEVDSTLIMQWAGGAWSIA